MKRSHSTFFALFVLCAAALCAPCAWAGSLSALYTYDDADVEKDEAGLFQIEAKREVQFIYNPGSFEKEAAYTISFSDGTSDTMTFSDGSYTCKHTFSSTGEIGISIDTSGFTPTSADITQAMPFELYPPKMSMRPNEPNRFVRFKGESNILSYSVEHAPNPSSMADTGYETTFNPPHITVTTKGATGKVKVLVTISNDSVKFTRVCTITIDPNSTESNMTYSEGGSGGGGGCDSGVTGLSLLLLAGLGLIRRRKA